MHILCRFKGHTPAAHAVLLVGQAVTHCTRCDAHLVSDGGEWIEMEGNRSERLQQIMRMLQED